MYLSHKFRKLISIIIFDTNLFQIILYLIRNVIEVIFFIWLIKEISDKMNIWQNNKLKN